MTSINVCDIPTEAYQLNDEDILIISKYNSDTSTYSSKHLKWNSIRSAFETLNMSLDDLDNRISILETESEEPEPEKPQCSATLGGINNTVTCTANTPSSGATIYNKQNVSNDWSEGSSVTLSFSADGTKTVYFKVSAPDYNDLGADYTFGMKVTRTTNWSWGSWSYVAGPYTTSQEATVAAANFKNAYDDTKVQMETVSGKTWYAVYGRNRIYTYSYTRQQL